MQETKNIKNRYPVLYCFLQYFIDKLRKFLFQ